MELLNAFGPVRAFHLVKAEPTAITSKGYCFVEYSDRNVTSVAVMGLNGMDMGNGKVLSARVAARRDGTSGIDGTPHMGMSMGIPGMGMMGVGVVGNVDPIQFPNGGGASTFQMNGGNALGAKPIVPYGTGIVAGGMVPPPMSIVDGVDIQTLLNVAMGSDPKAAILTAHWLGVGNGVGILVNDGNDVVGVVDNGATATTTMASSVPSSSSMNVTSSNEVNTEIDTNMTHVMNVNYDTTLDDTQQHQQQQQQVSESQPQQTIPKLEQQPQKQPTRVLVLLNMVTEEDFESSEDYEGLVDEVKEESETIGKLLSLKIPRPITSGVRCFVVLFVVCCLLFLMDILKNDKHVVTHNHCFFSSN